MHFNLLLPVFLVLVFSHGCVKSESRLATVHGRVTRDGRPVPGAQLLFMPPGERVATGVTNPDGHYQLSTLDENDGAVVGQHLVAIIHRPSIPVPPMSGSPSAIPEPGVDDDRVDDDWVSLIPDKYANSNDPQLSVRIDAGDNKIDFNFKNEPKEGEAYSPVVR